MTGPLFICTDLDRTLLPNGEQAESPEARPRFRALAAREGVRIAYVSGRDEGLIRQAIADYDLPMADFAVGDVGTSIYRVLPDGGFVANADWWARIGRDWHGLHGVPGVRAPELSALFQDIAALILQEPAKQGRYKLSYYAPDDLNAEAVFAEMRRRLDGEGLKADIIWSIDETTATGLVDVIPQAASKRDAVMFLIEAGGFSLNQTVFAGDSGNDLAVIASAIPSVLVGNATEAIKREAKTLAEANGTAEACYLAKGGLFAMNGNYAAGILEGVAHYHPEAVALMAL